MDDRLNWLCDLHISSINVWRFSNVDRCSASFLQKCSAGRVVVIVECSQRNYKTSRRFDIKISRKLTMYWVSRTAKMFSFTEVADPGIQLTLLHKDPHIVELDCCCCRHSTEGLISLEL